jgi:hypothetical protein
MGAARAAGLCTCTASILSPFLWHHYLQTGSTCGVITTEEVPELKAILLPLHCSTYTNTHTLFAGCSIPASMQACPLDKACNAKSLSDRLIQKAQPDSKLHVAGTCTILLYSNLPRPHSSCGGTHCCAASCAAASRAGASQG